jgi:hypothetical protein
VKALKPVVFRGHVSDDVYEALVEGDAEVWVTLRRPFRSLTLAIVPAEEERWLPAGCVLRRVPFVIIPT